LLQWFIRNISLLISGLVLLPLAIYALIMLIAFSYIFSKGDSLLATIFMLLIGLYAIVFGVSVRLSLLSYKKNGNYAYWDFVPMIYFFLVTISFYWGKI
jgi:hypothetical protein